MRIKRLQSALKKEGADAALVYSFTNTDRNLFYLTGMDIEYSFLLVPKKGNSTLMTSKLEYERARRSGRMKTVAFEKPPFQFVAKRLARARRIGINTSVVPVREFRELKKHMKGKRFFDISRLMLGLRQAKDEKEVAAIKRACRITDEIYRLLIRSFRFRTEQQVIGFLRQEALKRGCELSFKPIVASGARASMPHYSGLGRLGRGFCVIDFGINCGGYMSDMTRTIYLGRPTDAEKRLYSRLLAIQQKTIASVRSGMKAAALSLFARRELGPLEKLFIHGLGHGIGVQIHELPSISANSKDRMLDGSIFTIEPGIYLPGKYGIRIEDDVLLRNSRPLILTKSPKELIAIP